MHIFQTLQIGTEQSCEAENSCVVFHLSRRFILQDDTFITHKFLKIIKGQDPLEGEKVEVCTSKYLPRSYFSL